MEANHIVAVQCRGLTRSYGIGDARVQALRGVDFDIYFGKLLMLVGPSGKTTLISIIAGILDQDAGDCTVLNRDLQRMRAAERARFRGASIGFVFQTFNLLASLNIIDNVAVPLLINGLPRKQAAARAILDTLGLGERGVIAWAAQREPATTGGPRSSARARTEADRLR